jgi:hypothetical protein
VSTVLPNQLVAIPSFPNNDFGVLRTRDNPFATMRIGNCPHAQGYSSMPGVRREWPELVRN